MAIDETAPNRLAQQALASGGLSAPLSGNDVLDLDPERLELPDLSTSDAEIQVGEETQLAMSKLLPNSGLLSNAQLKLKALQDQAEQQQFGTGAFDSKPADPPDTLGLRPEGEQIAAPIKPLNLEDESLSTSLLGIELEDDYSEFDEAAKKAYAIYGKKSDISVSAEDASSILNTMTSPISLGRDGMLKDFRAVGAAGDAKIPNEGTILSSIEAISDKYGGQITAEKRDKITLEATRQMADLVGVTPERLRTTILSRQRGGAIFDSESGAGLAETMLASRDLLVSELIKLDELAKLAVTGGDEEALRFRTQLELVGLMQAQIKGAQTEIARALSSFRIPARGGQAGSDMLSQDLSTLLEDYGGTQSIRDKASAYLQNGNNVAAKAATARGSVGIKVFDAFYEMWINVLLSNPVSHVKNTVGAFLTTFAHVPETYAAATVGAIQRARGREGGVYYGQANAQLFGMVLSLREAFGAAGKSFTTGQNVLPGTKLEGGGGRRNQNAFSSEGMQEGHLATVVDILGHILTLGRIPTRALEFEDTFFKVVAHRASLYENAYSTGITKGLRGDALSTHIAEYLFDPPTEGISKANAHAKYVTLQSDLDAAGRALKGVRDKVPGMRYFVPFLKTPYNSFKYAFIDRGPIGAFYGESRRAIERAKLPGATQADKQAADMAMARLVMGNATGLIVFSMVASGEITGNGPSDPGLRQNLLNQGWIPYSTKVPGTDPPQYVSYQGLEPFSSLIMLGADAGEALFNASVKQAETDKIISGLAASFAYQATDKTFMQGFNKLIKTLNDPTRNAGTTAQAFVGSLVPRAVAQVERAGIPGVFEGDPVIRATRTYLDEIVAQLPGFSATLPPRRDLYGQAIMLSGAAGPDIASPLYTSVRGPNPKQPDKKYAKRAADVAAELSAVEFSPSQHGNMAVRPKGGFYEGVEMTPEEQDIYHQYAGKRTLELFEATIKSDEFKKAKKFFTDDKNSRAQRLVVQQAISKMFRKNLKTARDSALIDLINDPIVGNELEARLEVSREAMRGLSDELERAFR